jgi:RNase H-fold protein (predicted Holliday junction resolvase)
VSAKESKSKIDAMAAVVILENALARERLAGEL